jgi:hypothetical protein
VASLHQRQYAATVVHLPLQDNSRREPPVGHPFYGARLIPEDEPQPPVVVDRSRGQAMGRKHNPELGSLPNGAQRATATGLRSLGLSFGAIGPAPRHQQAGRLAPVPQNAAPGHHARSVLSVLSRHQDASSVAPSASGPTGFVLASSSSSRQTLGGQPLDQHAAQAVVLDQAAEDARLLDLDKVDIEQVLPVQRLDLSVGKGPAVVPPREKSVSAVRRRPSLL